MIASPQNICKNCKWFDPYFSSLGECLEPITTWNRKWLLDEVDESTKPKTPDRMSHETCQNFEVKP